MADQATVNRGAKVRINSPLAEGVIGNLAEFAGDVSTLAELQAKLALSDLKTLIGRAILPAALLGLGVLLLLAALPVVLIGASELLASALNLKYRGWAYLMVAGASLVLTAVLLLLSWPRLLASLEALAHTREELARNVAWVRTVLVNSGRTPPHQRK